MALHVQQEELCSLRCQVDSLIHHRQQTDMELSSLQQCLNVIEAECQLTDAGIDAVRQARQHVSRCAEACSAAVGVDSSWMLMHQQSESQLIDTCQVCGS